MADFLDLIAGPGEFGSVASDGSLPDRADDNFLDNLPSLASLSSSPRLSLPTNFTIPDTTTSTLPQMDNGIDLGFTSGGGSENGFDVGSFFGGLLGEGVKVAGALWVNPAIAQAQLPAQRAQLQDQLTLQAAQSQIQTQAVVTIIMWAAVAFGVVFLLRKI